MSTKKVHAHEDNNAPRGNARKAAAMAAEVKLRFLRELGSLLEKTKDDIDNLGQSVVAALRAGMLPDELIFESYHRWLHDFALMEDLHRRMAMHAKACHFGGSSTNSQRTGVILAKVAWNDSRTLTHGRNASENGLSFADPAAGKNSLTRQIESKLQANMKTTQAHARRKPKERAKMSADDRGKMHSRNLRKIATNSNSRHHKHLGLIEGMDSVLE